MRRGESKAFKIPETSVEELSIKKSQSQLSYGEQGELQRNDTKDSTMEVPKFGIANFSASYKYFSPEKVPSIDTAAEIEFMDNVVAKSLKLEYCKQDIEVGSDNHSFEIETPERSPSISPEHPDLNRDVYKANKGVSYDANKNFESIWDNNNKEINQNLFASKEEHSGDYAVGFDKQPTGSPTIPNVESGLSAPSPAFDPIAIVDTLKGVDSRIEKSDAIVTNIKMPFKPILLESDKNKAYSMKDIRSDFKDDESKHSYEEDDEIAIVSSRKKTQTTLSSCVSIGTDTSSVSQITTKTARSNMSNVFNITRLTAESQTKMDHSLTELIKVIFRESKVQVPSSFIILPYEFTTMNGIITFDKELSVALGERLLDVIRASSFIRKRNCSEDELGDGVDDYTRNINNLRRSIDKLLKFYSQYELRMYLVDEFDGFPIIPHEYMQSPYPLKVPNDCVQNLFPLMHLSVILSRTWNGLDGLARILTGNQLSVDLSLAWTPANGAKETKMDPVVHADEIRVIREALKLYSSSVYHREKTSSPEMSCLNEFYRIHDSKNTYCNMIRVLDAWGSTLWTSAENLAEMREEASPESLLNYLNYQRQEREDLRLKDQSVSYYYIIAVQHVYVQLTLVSCI